LRKQIGQKGYKTKGIIAGRKIKIIANKVILKETRNENI